ncbi:Dymeclin, partial [Sarcoptes scabiei]
SDANFMNENIIPFLGDWIENNPTSLNLSSMIQVFYNKIQLLKKDSQKTTTINYNVLVWHGYNLAFIMRTMFKYMIETLTEENVIKNCRSSFSIGTNVTQTPIENSDDTKTINGHQDDGQQMIELLLSTLIEILVDLKIDDLSYSLHVESFIYTIVMQNKCSIHALLLTKTLLNNFIQQIPVPTPPSGSIIFGLASGFWNALTLGYANKKTDDAIWKEALLARESLLLLLVLTNHCTKDLNPYREALFHCCDSNLTMSSEQPHKPTGFKIEFSKLYRTLCQTLNDDQTTLLLYMLIHQNHQFKTFILSRTTDLDQFIVPVLKILYDSPHRNSHHIYMSLIILLVLSEDNQFNSIIHDIIVRNLSWYTERSLKEISLGGLIILVIIRTIHFNTFRNQDRFLHTNLCATLANMSNHFKHLHICVCEKLVLLFKKISKKYFKLKSLDHRVINDDNSSGAIITNIATSDVSNSIGGDSDDYLNNHSNQLNQNDEFKDLSLYEEVLRTIVEIINASFSKNLLTNPNLIHNLLCDRQIFEPFHNHPLLKDLISNIDTVLSFFWQRIEQQGSDLTADEILSIIKLASFNWSKDKMKRFPELMFRYVEDEQPEDFFIPYIWSLVFRCSDIYWNSQNILLFNPIRNI